MRYLRKPGQKRILWIDALYIDQNNNKERRHQMAQMSKIYAQAQSVRVWLGLDHREGKIAATFNYLKESQVTFWSKPHYSAYASLK